MLSLDREEAVAAYLEAAHEIGNHLLAALDEAATRVGARYYLTSGTLLGAVRSEDWIPWDDDIDVIMFRDEFERFRRDAPAVLPPDVLYSDALSHPHHFTAIPRLLHLGSRRLHSGRTRAVLPIEARHVPLDIFVLDRAPRHLVLRRAWSAVLYLLDAIVRARHTTVGDVIREPLTGWTRKLSELVAVAISRLFRRNSAYRLRTWLARLPSRFGPDGPYVATNYSTPAGRRMTFRRESHEPGIPIRFAGMTCRGPSQVSEVLTTLYGPDYLTPPPAVQRVPDHLRGGLIAVLGQRTWEIRWQ